MRTHSSTTQTTGLAISRRRLTQAAWAAPVVLATTAVPGYAASKTVPTVDTTFFAVSSTAEDLETGYRRPSLGFWFTAPIDETTFTPLGGTTTLTAGSTFLITISMTYADGETPAPPADWGTGTATYPATGSNVPYETPDVNSAAAQVEFLQATVTDNTWEGSYVVTTLEDAVMTGADNTLGAQILFPAKALGFPTDSLADGYIRLSTGSGTLQAAAPNRDAVTVSLDTIPDMVLALYDRSTENLIGPFIPND